MRTCMDVLCQKKPAQVLLCIKESSTPLYATRVARQTDSAGWYVAQLLKRLEEEDIITRRREGRTKHVKLTQKGLVIAVELDNIRHALGS